MSGEYGDRELSPEQIAPPSLDLKASKKKLQFSAEDSALPLAASTMNLPSIALVNGNSMGGSQTMKKLRKAKTRYAKKARDSLFEDHETVETGGG